MKTKWKEKSEWDGLHMTSSTYIFPFIELHAAPTPLMDKSINSWLLEPTKLILLLSYYSG